jgi:hypothetical protein
VYQLYTSPAPCNPLHKHPQLQHKYTQTHTRATKLSNPQTSSPNQPPLFLSPFFKCHLHQFPKIYY